MTNKKEQHDRLNRMRGIAKIMDSEFSFLGISYGLDAIIGLIPWLGDVLTGIVSVYIVWEAYKIGVPEKMLRRMISNVIVDVFIGGVPVLGDIFDVLFKANKRNVAMVEKYLQIGELKEV